MMPVDSSIVELHQHYLESVADHFGGAEGALPLIAREIVEAAKIFDPVRARRLEKQAARFAGGAARTAR